MIPTSSSLNQPRSRPVNTRSILLILALLAVGSMGGYLLASALRHNLGFPLDDSWIHQTYARNLAVHGEWAFILGEPSGGSTAPLWSGLLAIGYLLKLAPFAWTFLLGVMTLWGLSLLGEFAMRKMVLTYQPRFPWVGAILIMEWHLVWAAASGMETLLFALIATGILILIILDTKKYFGLGLLIGLSVWVRPDGITLLGPAVVVVLLGQPSWRKRLRGLANIVLGFGSPFALYLLFNLIITGHPWPNTFYAKQAEYAVLLKQPFLKRLVGEALQPLLGVGVILLPGLILTTISAIKRQAWGILVSVTWVVGFLVLYAWRLPATYQYGRYVMPIMPVYFLLGLIGMIESFIVIRSRFQWILGNALKLLIGIILVSFWGLGAYSYAKDVAYIDNEMVTTAHWVANNVPAGDLVAVHDIGAMGYFGNHDLVDLAGLITPEVIPFILNEDKLATYLDGRSVKYLVVFPDWYPKLIKGLNPIFITSTVYPPNSGGSNMAVYRWLDR